MLKNPPVLGGDLFDFRTCAHCGAVTKSATVYTLDVPYGSASVLPGKKLSRTLTARSLFIQASICVHCFRPVVVMNDEKVEVTAGEVDGNLSDSGNRFQALYPPGIGTEPLHAGVPEPTAGDFQAAAAVGDISPGASGVLCRRIVQRLLKACPDIRGQHLGVQIKEFREAGAPPRVVDLLEAVKNLGNYGAHPDDALGSDLDRAEAEELLHAVRELILFFHPEPAARDSLVSLQSAIARRKRPEG